MPSSARPFSLPRAYRKLNKRWFSNKLPADTIVGWAPIKDMGCTVDGPHGRLVVAINKSFRKWPVQAECTLLHEMVHVATWDEQAMHGTKWKALMAKLYKRGAFLAYL